MLSARKICVFAYAKCYEITCNIRNFLWSHDIAEALLVNAQIDSYVPGPVPLRYDVCYVLNVYCLYFRVFQSKVANVFHKFNIFFSNCFECVNTVNKSICNTLHQNVFTMNCANVLCMKSSKKWFLFHWNGPKSMKYFCHFAMKDPVNMNVYKY